MLDWIITAACLSGIYSYLIERHWLDIREIHIHLDVPQSFANLRIALFSDTHLGFFYKPKHLSLLIKKIHALNPDVICFTGDLLNDNTCLRELEPSVNLLAQLQAPLGKFAVIGNHDYHTGLNETVKGLERGGFRVLQNEHETISRGSDHLTFIGLDDVMYGKPNLSKALENSPAIGARILLVHEPDYAQFSSPVPITLQLSGHSHGGQVRIPFFGPILTTKLGKKYAEGLHLGKNGHVYTTRGIGTTHLPVRFCCRPELTLITLA